MRNTINKKALSGGTTLSLVLIMSIAAVIIAIPFILNLSNQPLLSPENSCLNINLQPPIKLQSACFNSTSLDIQTTLSRDISSNEDITSLRFVLSSPAIDRQWICGSNNQCGSCTILQAGETKNYNFQYSSSDAADITVYVNNCQVEKRKINSC